MTPPMTIAHSGRAEGGFRSEGAPRGVVHGSFPIPPPGAAPQPQPNAHAGGKCADDKRGARVGNRGRPPEGEQGGRGATPPPPAPPPARKPRGPRPPPPEAGGMVPPPPARERSWSTARPPAPAAGSHRNRGEQASPRQRARTPHTSRPVKAGEHEPEWYGDHAPHDQSNASDTRFVACPGKAEGRNEAERPPALQAPPAAQTGGRGARAAPPPQPVPRHTNATDPPHGGLTARSQVGGRPPTTPAARSPHRACRPGGHCWAPTHTRPRPQHVGSGPQQPAQWAGSRGRGSA